MIFDEFEPLKGLHVLVVEDDRDECELYVLAIERYGGRATTARSTFETVAALGASRPDVLLSCVTPPGADGFELIRAVRALGSEEGGGVPALVVTGWLEQAERERAIRAGFQAHLVKPVGLRVLAGALAALARAGRPPREAATGPSA